jgi:hypothetical protein
VKTETPSANGKAAALDERPLLSTMPFCSRQLYTGNTS